MMHNDQFSRESSLGCGFLGCLGDLIGGFVLGVIGVALLSLALALIAPMPVPPDRATPDVRLSASEDFLNRFVQTSTDDESVQVDILPGGQFEFLVDTAISVLGASIPVQLSGLFDVRLDGQLLQVRLLETRVSDMTLPPELADFFVVYLDEVNNELNTAVGNVSTALGVPITFVGVGSDGNTFWLEATVSP